MLRCLLWAFLVATSGAMTWIAPAAADEDEDPHQFLSDYQRNYVFGTPASPSDEWLFASGGRLYDNWAEALDTELPSETHPAYPAEGKQAGSATWRCKECHGWDYRGRDGAYGAGSHRTGITGLRHMVGADPAKVVQAVRGPRHGYGPAMIPDAALDRLAGFVVAGQVDTAALIDGTGKLTGGSAARGKAVFQNICAACHGFDGRAIDFSHGEEPEFVGTVAVENPWEAIHKIANGQPGAPMPALRMLGIDTVADVLAHARTLPAHSGTAD